MRKDDTQALEAQLQRIRDKAGGAGCKLQSLGTIGTPIFELRKPDYFTLTFFSVGTEAAELLLDALAGEDITAVERERLDKFEKLLDQNKELLNRLDGIPRASVQALRDGYQALREADGSIIATHKVVSDLDTLLSDTDSEPEGGDD